MPRAPKVCSHKDCIELVHGGTRCPQHKVSGWSSSPRTASAGRTGTSAWRRTRAYVLHRDNHTCQIRGPRCTTQATEVDHIKPVSLGGTDFAINCQATCHTCHAWKTAQEANTARQ